MRFKYILYPEAIEKLDSSGIIKRVNEARKRDDLSIMGHISESDVASMVAEMRESGIFRHIPREDAKDFGSKMNSLFQSPESHFWQTNRFNGQQVREEVEMEDILGMVGWWSSRVLKPEEVFDYQRFGFGNLTDFTGSVAALITNTLHPDFREGYKWKFKTEDRRVFTNEITGSEHADLRIHRTDITPYETLNPLDNQVSYRPEMRSDMLGVFAYHSTEAPLLAAVLKWIEQCNIKAETLENKAQDVIEWARSLGQSGGFTTEHFFTSPDGLATKLSFNFGIPLPFLDENDRSEKSTSYGLVSDSSTFYGIYTDPRKNLVFTVESQNETSSPDKKIAARFMPEEADHMIKGLLYQSAKGLGRTSGAQLINVLEYRFSPQYEADLKEFSRS